MIAQAKFLDGELSGFSLAGLPLPKIAYKVSRSFHERTGALVPNGRPLVVLVPTSRGNFRYRSTWEDLWTPKSADFGSPTFHLGPGVRFVQFIR